MLENVLPSIELRGLATKKRRALVQESVANKDLEDRLKEGWTLARSNKNTSVVTKPKRHDVYLEDRVWMLLYRMGFKYLSGAGGAILTVNSDGDENVRTQIDVVAMDDEVVIAIECKSSQTSARRQLFQQELAKHSVIKAALSRSMQRSSPKRTPVLAFATHNAILGENDKTRADEQRVVLFDDDDLSYYEQLTSHLGPAARYQFLADLIPGKSIPGLTVRLPAVKTRMGNHNCYTFSISPEYLLKIAYVSHRAKGKGSDVEAYQRMVSKSRLTKISQYISEGGIFSTNVVINIEKGKKGSLLTFERARQAEDSEDSATFGWLTLKPAYKSAWIIDGQHRLFAYSGHPLASKSQLVVLAFEGLEGSEQMKLFTDINAKQKSVKQSLLQELYADLHTLAADPEVRTQALISRSIQALGKDRESPFYDRILLAERVRTPTRCISLTSMFSALEKSGFYFRSIRAGMIQDPGPFWTGEDESTIKRTNDILRYWFQIIRDAVPEWWELGSGDGGGLAMNNGITVCINVLRSVFEYLDQGRTKLTDLRTSEVQERVKPFALELGLYFAAFSEGKKAEFRALQGVYGQTAGTRHAQAFLQKKFPSFQPEGLKEFLEREEAKTNEKASALVRDIELILHRRVIEGLKSAFQDTEDQWWYDGVPDSVRKPVAQRIEDNKGKAGSREAYLDLIHYREIILSNWQIFGEVFNYGTGDKKKKTSWLAQVNETRNVVAHASRGATVSYEQLNLLQDYSNWLHERLMEGEYQGVSDLLDALHQEPEVLVLET